MSNNTPLRDGNELAGKVGELHVVGDAVAPRRILYATRDGNRVGREL